MDDGARGGPGFLVLQPFYLGINDPLGGNPTGAAFTSVIFNLHDNWANRGPAHSAIARGQHTLQNVVEFYNTRFKLHLTLQQQADLVAFLRTL